jgi:hypothetical protein
MVAMRVGLLIAAVVALALLGGCGDSDDDGGSTTLTLLSAPTDFEVVDNGDQGPTRGDTQVFTAPLTDEHSGREVGRFDGTGTITGFDKRNGQLVDLRTAIIQFTLEDGTVVAGGVLPGPTRTGKVVGEVVRPILGGTGKYRSAGGEVTQTQLADGRLRNILEIETDD